MNCYDPRHSKQVCDVKYCKSCQEKCNREYWGEAGLERREREELEKIVGA